jgi:hypothetical protein
MNYRHACCKERDRLDHGLTALLLVQSHANPREPAVRIREELVSDVVVGCYAGSNLADCRREPSGQRWLRGLGRAR